MHPEILENSHVMSINTFTTIIFTLYVTLYSVADDNQVFIDFSVFCYFQVCAKLM